MVFHTLSISCVAASLLAAISADGRWAIVTNRTTNTYTRTLEYIKHQCGCSAMEHRGISNRTGRPRRVPVQSAPRNHSETCSGDLSLQDFSIIGGAKYVTDLHILESLKIFKLKPNLNEMESAHPLLVVNH